MLSLARPDDSCFAALARLSDAGCGAMPFSAIAELMELAAARDAFEAAWAQIQAMHAVLPCGEASNREWLAHIVFGLNRARPGDDIAPLAVEQFLATVPISHL